MFHSIYSALLAFILATSTKPIFQQDTSFSLLSLAHMVLGDCFVHTHSIRKFPGQVSNLQHSSNLSHCSDHARSLTHGATRELLEQQFLECAPWTIGITLQLIRDTNSQAPFRLHTLESLGVKPHSLDACGNPLCGFC